MIDLTEAERAALAAFLRDAIAADRFPMSPRLRPIARSITFRTRRAGWRSGPKKCLPTPEDV